MSSTAVDLLHVNNIVVVLVLKMTYLIFQFVCYCLIYLFSLLYDFLFFSFFRYCWLKRFITTNHFVVSAWVYMILTKKGKKENKENVKRKYLDFSFKQNFLKKNLLWNFFSIKSLLRISNIEKQRRETQNKNFYLSSSSNPDQF